ncbi:2-amino-4-hydroxy-6-hydroxymethyldihydropteridine diphosphokinase [Candidatus Pelagibacter sp.]|nr:2-amino-4-hydroxy-6-hydroxymethyldihydropteridine diphosphokinase [Candidatus Pelagibacter sp.]
MIEQDLLENQVKFSYIAIGSNLGNRVINIEKAKSELQNNEIKIIKCSSNFESVSWPDPSNPKYINIVIKIKSDLSPLNLLKKCNLIEQKLGRKRYIKNAPRTCDIDIIDYKQKILNLGNGNLILPHPKMNNRSFVLLPLFEINKSWKCPISKRKIAQLINSLPTKDLKSINQL